MWDYNNGLVRVTPFFKACKFSKTTPAKALNANEGLKELSHSITGGALVAQGYWMPYPCARAICLTFAHDIRWALTPIFGPSFIRECLHPTDLGSQRWKIDPEVIRIAKMDVEGWLSSEVPIKEEKGIPRSVPVEHQEEVMRQKPAKPTFKQGSPFDGSDSGTSEISNPYGLATPHPLGSPEISPRSSTFPTTSWATINRPNADRSSPPSPPQNSPVGSLSNALLNEPGFPQWRAAENTNVEHNTAPTSSGNKRARRPSIDGTYADSAFGNYSDEMDVDASPPARGALGSSGHGRVGRHPPEQWRGPLPDGKSKVVTVEAVRAAQCLVQLAGNNPSFGNVKTEF